MAWVGLWRWELVEQGAAQREDGSSNAALRCREWMVPMRSAPAGALRFGVVQGRERQPSPHAHPHRRHRTHREGESNRTLRGGGVTLRDGGLPLRDVTSQHAGSASLTGRGVLLVFRDIICPVVRCFSFCLVRVRARQAAAATNTL